MYLPETRANKRDMGKVWSIGTILQLDKTGGISSGVLCLNEAPPYISKWRGLKMYLLKKMIKV